MFDDDVVVSNKFLLFGSNNTMSSHGRHLKVNENAEKELKEYCRISRMPEIGGYLNR